MVPNSVENEPRQLRAARAVAMVCFAFYLVWNARFLLRHQIPPSIWLAVTGLPCPTTGCTRSLIAASHGHWRESLSFNPFTLPFLFLIAASIAVLIRRQFQKRRLVLPRSLATCWFACLTLAWIVQTFRAVWTR